MRALLRLSHAIDTLNEKAGHVAIWLVLIACVISAGNALMRYAFSLSSNAWLEIQWYLFGGIVMLGAAYTLQRNEHVRVDVLLQLVTGARTRLWIDLLGDALLPAADEQSSSAGCRGRCSSIRTRSEKSPATRAGCCAGR